MKNLLAFFLKYRFFFLFISLEVIAFSMIINHTHYHRYVLFNSASRFTGTMYSWNMGVREYFSLKQDNILLAAENARLREKMAQSLYFSDTTSIHTIDSLTKQQFTYIPARVVKNSTSKRNNYLMIDRGRKHGIEPYQAVITSNGVVGVVLNVSEHYAWVMSVLNSHSRINGRLKRTGYQGSLWWDGHDYVTGTFSDVPSHAEILTGDTVVTSGFSLMFPAGIMIGTVKDYYVIRGEHFNTVKLQFSVDYNRLSHVYVVRNLMKEEQESIIEEL